MNKFALIAAAAAAFSASVTFASTPAQSAASSAIKPVPVHVVNPTDLPIEALNSTVDMVMTIDEKGVPHDVRSAHFVNRQIAQRLEAALSQWRFQPQYVDGRAVPTRVVLPLTLVDENSLAARQGLASASATNAN